MRRSPISITSEFQNASFTPAARARAHARAAQLLADQLAPPERVAVHLVHCEPAADPVTCDRLIDGGRAALAHGAPEAATIYLRRALAEPPAPERRNAVLRELGTAEGLSFEVQAAAAHTREAFECAANRAERLQSALLASSLAGHHAGADEGIELLARSLREFADDQAAAATIAAQITNVARFELRARRSALPISHRLRTARHREPVTDPTVLAAVAAELAMAAEPAMRVAETAVRGLRELATRRRPAGDMIQLILIRTLIVSDCFKEAARALEELLQDSRRGDPRSTSPSPQCSARI